MDAAQALLVRYGNRSRDEFTTHAAEYGARFAAWRQSCEQLSHAAAQRQRLLDEKNRQTAQLIGSAAMLAPDVQTLDDAGPRRRRRACRVERVGCSGRLCRAGTGAV